ncbi:unnamed protein product [Symbiodinium sp. CCMP2592]|nr:unnamed protein product [Symbiodinium sp. CCMP2592]
MASSSHGVRGALGYLWLQVAFAGGPLQTEVTGDDSRSLQSSGCFEAATCEAGSFLDAGGTCRRCPPGYFTPQANMRQCLECDSGRYAGEEGTSRCISCPAGRYAPSPARTECRDCPPGRFTSLPQAIECLECPSGRFTPSTSNWTECRNCLPGRFAKAPGLTECDACPTGRAAPEESRSCEECDVGRYSKKDGASMCKFCKPGHMQNKRGRSSCKDCGSWYWPRSSLPDYSNCETDFQALAGLVLVFLSSLGLFSLSGKVLRHTVPLQDVKLEVSQSKGRLILTTHGHHLLPCTGMSWRSPSAFATVDETGRQTTTSFNIDSSRVKLKRSRQVPITIFGTGHPQLDAECQTEGWVFPAAAAATASAILSIAEKVRPHYPEPEVTESPRFLVQAVTSQHLLLLSPEGHPETRALETSQGHLVVTFPSTLWAVCPLGVPLFVHLSTLLALFAAPACAFLRKFLELFAVAVGLSLIVGAGLAALWGHRTFTPLQLKLIRHKLDLQQAVPTPQECPRGPSRAVKGGQLWCFYDTFEPFIRSRTLYYVVANIIKPLTREAQLSYAEVAGPHETGWFCSHFWGTSFAHFVRSICKHAEAACGLHGCAWQDITYWICSFSNNQWRIQEELGISWESSSFYLALKSPNCCGTAMVVDDYAMPLTRAWCLFEVLQTRLKENEADNFQGLWLCTSSGVLHEGKAGVDVAMRIAERLATLRLEDATASVKKDKDMIDELVAQMPGGFPAMNRFVRQKIYDALLAMRSSFSADFNTLLQSLHGETNTLLQSLHTQGALPAALPPPASEAQAHETDDPELMPVVATQAQAAGGEILGSLGILEVPLGPLLTPPESAPRVPALRASAAAARGDNDWYGSSTSGTPRKEEEGAKNAVPPASESSAEDLHFPSGHNSPRGEDKPDPVPRPICRGGGLPEAAARKSALRDLTAQKGLMRFDAIASELLRRAMGQVAENTTASDAVPEMDRLPIRTAELQEAEDTEEADLDVRDDPFQCPPEGAEAQISPHLQVVEQPQAIHDHSKPNRRSMSPEQDSNSSLGFASPEVPQEASAGSFSFGEQGQNGLGVLGEASPLEEIPTKGGVSSGASSASKSHVVSCCPLAAFAAASGGATRARNTPGILRDLGLDESSDDTPKTDTKEAHGVMTLYERFKEAFQERCQAATKEEEPAAALAQEFLAAHGAQVQKMLDKFEPDGKLRGGESVPASAYNDFYKWTMLPVTRAVERGAGAVQCTFSANIRDAGLSKALVEAARQDPPGPLFDCLKSGLEELASRPFDVAIFDRCRKDSALPGWDDETLAAVCGTAECPRTLAQEVDVDPKGARRLPTDANNVLLQAFVGHDIKSGSDRVYVEATGTGQIHIIHLTIYETFFRLRMRERYGSEDSSWYARWLAEAFIRCARSVLAAKASKMRGVIMTGRRTGGLALMMLQGMFIQSTFRDAEGKPLCLGTSSVTAHYWLKDAGVPPEILPVAAGTHAHELSMVCSAVLSDVDDAAGLPMSQAVGHALYFLCSRPGGDVREAGRKALMPMLPDTLGTKSFFRTVSQLKVPEGPQKGEPFLSVIGAARQDSGTLEGFRDLVKGFGFEGGLMASEIEEGQNLLDASVLGYGTFGAGGFFGDSEKAWSKEGSNISMAIKVLVVHVNGQRTSFDPVKTGDPSKGGEGKFEADGLMAAERLDALKARTKLMQEAEAGKGTSPAPQSRQYPQRPS